MTPDLDPLQPWRPRGDEPYLPTDPSPHPGATPDAVVAPPREVLWSEPSPVVTPSTTLRLDQTLFLVLSVVMLGSGMVVLAWQGVPHVSRVFAALSVFEVGLIGGLLLARKRHWLIRLACVGAGLAGVVLVWLYVPTTGGLSFMDAQDLLAEARGIPAGEVDSFLQTRPRREKLVAQYPTLKPEVDQIEQAWFTQTADLAVAKADALLPTDPGTAAAQLRQLDNQIRPVRNYALVRDRLQEARGRAVRAQMKAFIGNAKAQAAKGRFAEVKGLTGQPALVLLRDAQELDILPEVSAGLMDTRRHIVRLRLDAARREVRTLLRANQFAAVAARGEQLDREVGDEAMDVGLGPELKQFRTACEVFGILARQAGGKAPK